MEFLIMYFVIGLVILFLIRKFSQTFKDHEKHMASPASGDAIMILPTWFFFVCLWPVFGTFFLIITVSQFVGNRMTKKHWGIEE